MKKKQPNRTTKVTTVTLPPELIDSAKRLGINVSRVAAAALRRRVVMEEIPADAGEAVEKALSFVTEAKKGDVREPSRAVLAEWVVDWIIATAPKPSTLVLREDIEQLTGLKWDSQDLKFVLIAAKPKLYRTTRHEWRVTDKGLYMLNADERKDELYRRQRESLSRHRETLASAATIPMDELTAQGRAEVEHAKRVALHLYEEGKRALRKKWLNGGDEAKKIE